MLTLQVDSSDGTMHTALQKACHEGHSEVVSFLLKRGAKTDLMVRFGIGTDILHSLPISRIVYCRFFCSVHSFSRSLMAMFFMCIICVHPKDEKMNNFCSKGLLIRTRERFTITNSNKF